MSGISEISAMREMRELCELHKKVRSSGFTLIELMVVLALVAIVASFAVPSFSTIIANGRIASSSNDVVGVLNYARAEAVKRGRIVRVSPVSGADWTSGAVAWVDENDDGARQATEILRQTSAVPGAVTLTATANVAFTGGGFSSTTPTLTICDDRSGERGREVTITAGGRIRAEDITCT